MSEKPKEEFEDEEPDEAEEAAEDLDVDQFAHDLYSVMLGYHHADRLLRDPRAQSRARSAFESLLSAARREPRRRTA